MVDLWILEVYVKPVETVEHEKRHWKRNTAATINPLGDFLRSQCEQTSAGFVVVWRWHANTEVFKGFRIGTDDRFQMVDVQQTSRSLWKTKKLINPVLSTFAISLKTGGRLPTNVDFSTIFFL